MTSISPIDVEEPQSAILIDFENIRLSWERTYHRVFRYTDICWLCELAEQRFKISIGRISVFMSDPEECEGTTGEQQLQEMRRTLRYLEEDERKTNDTERISERADEEFSNNNCPPISGARNRNLREGELSSIGSCSLAGGRTSMPSREATSGNSRYHGSIAPLFNCYSRDRSLSNTKPGEKSNSPDALLTSGNLSAKKQRVSHPTLFADRTRLDTQPYRNASAASRNVSAVPGVTSADLIEIVDLDDSDQDSFCGSIAGRQIPSMAENVTFNLRGIIPPNQPISNHSIATRNSPVRIGIGESGSVQCSYFDASERSSHSSSRSDDGTRSFNDSNEQVSEPSDEPFTRLGTTTCPRTIVTVQVFGYKKNRRRRVQKCCDVAIGNELTTLGFMAEYSNIILFSADSDFEETARSCSKAKKFGGLIKFAQKIAILGFSKAFRIMTLEKALQARRQRLLEHRSLSKELYVSNEPLIFLIDYEFPIIRTVLRRSERPFLEKRFKPYYPICSGNQEKDTNRSKPDCSVPASLFQSTQTSMQPGVHVDNRALQIPASAFFRNEDLSKNTTKLFPKKEKCQETTQEIQNSQVFEPSQKAKLGQPEIGFDHLFVNRLTNLKANSPLQNSIADINSNTSKLNSLFHLSSKSLEPQFDSSRFCDATHNTSLRPKLPPWKLNLVEARSVCTYP